MSHKFTEFQLEWLKALRSGEYKQGKDYLCKDGQYCCLGVACEIAPKFGVVFDEIIKRDGVVFFGDDHKEAPHKVYRQLGLKGSLGELYDSFASTTVAVKLPTGETGAALSEMNDGNMTFAAIADYIEKNPTQVFKQ